MPYPYRLLSNEQLQHLVQRELALFVQRTPRSAELFGKATGFNGGKGGSMHIADFSVGMLGANGVVAAGLPIAVGAAHAQKLQQRDAITAWAEKTRALYSLGDRPE